MANRRRWSAYVGSSLALDAVDYVEGALEISFVGRRWNSGSFLAFGYKELETLTVLVWYFCCPYRCEAARGKAVSSEVPC